MHRILLITARLMSFVAAASVSTAIMGQEAKGGASAREIASRLNADRADGDSFVRLKMEVKQAPDKAGVSMQVQVKSRRTAGGASLLYQLLWPKERKGESVLLRDKGDDLLFTPPDKLQTLSAAQLKQGLFGSDLSYLDLIENFFAWEKQTLLGTEKVDGVECQILESKPGAGDDAGHARVLTWVDTKRMVPLRVEKYAPADKLVRRINTTRVVRDEGRNIPASLSVQRPGQQSYTEVDGSRLRRGLKYSESELGPDAVRTVTSPQGGSESINGK